MNADNVQFLKKSFNSLLQQIPSDRPLAWGKMLLQPMIDHFTDAVRTTSGKLLTSTVFTKEEDLPNISALLKSVKPFHGNTPNSLMPEVSALVRNDSIGTATGELQHRLHYFFEVFEADPKLNITNSSFDNFRLRNECAIVVQT